MTLNPRLTRRRFIVTSASAGGGMMLGFYLPGAAEVLAVPPEMEKIAGQPWMSPTDAAGAEVNAWLVIAPDDTVTIRVAQSEMGEGVFTSMPMIVAEELQCDWNKVKAEYASANRSLRENQVYKRMSTNGSGAVRRSREYLQQAGASARQRLIQAAADQWGVPASACTSKDSVITHAPTGQTLRYGEIAAAAAEVQLPQEPAIKEPSEYTLMGQPVARLDTPLKVDGSAIFGADVRLPNMLYATSKTSPIVGASVKSYDFNAIKDRPGVHSVVQFGAENHPKGLRSGVAVVADTWYRAKTALDLLPIEWDYGPHTAVDSVKITEQDRQVLNEKSGAVALDEGDALGALRTASNLVEAVYGAPHQAHATMEPLGCTAPGAEQSGGCVAGNPRSGGCANRGRRTGRRGPGECLCSQLFPGRWFWRTRISQRGQPGRGHRQNPGRPPGQSDLEPGRGHEQRLLQSQCDGQIPGRPG